MATSKKAPKKGALREKKTTGDAKAASSKARVYDPSQSYKVDELVYHPKWQDEGPVTEVGVTGDGHHRMTVDFAGVGPKRLVIKYDLKI